MNDDGGRGRAIATTRSGDGTTLYLVSLNLGVFPVESYLVANRLARWIEEV